MPGNFVSISGISNKTQLKDIHKICREEDIGFRVVIGYQVSSKSINQGTKNPRQPRFADLENLIKRTLGCGFIPAIHYYTRESEAITEDIERIAEVLNPYLSLIQFNTLPPSSKILQKVKDIGFGIIFKVAVSDKKSGGYAVWKGEGVEDASSGQVEPLVEQVYDRKDVINYVMFDPSHGTNLELDLGENSLPIKFGKQIIENPELNHLGLIYAGGIKPTNVGLVTKSLLSFFKRERISIDVESGVRERNEFNMDLAREYLKNYRLAFHDCKKH